MKRNILRNWGSTCLVAMGILLPQYAHAHLLDVNIPGKKLNLQACFELASKQNLTLETGRKSVERAKVLQGTAWDIDKTDLSLSQDPSSGGSTDNAISISQSIEFPTVYAAKRGQLKAETKAEESRLAVLSQQVRADIASTYYAMLYQTHRLHILQQQDSILDRYYEVASKRYKAGEDRQLEVLSAERSGNENHLEMTITVNAIKNEQAKLMELLNTHERVLPAEADLSPITFVANGEYNYALTADAAYQNDRLKALDKGVKVAKAGYAPSISLALHNQLVISGWNPYHIDRSRFAEGNFMGFEVGVGIPLFYGATKAKVKAAQKERELAELEMQQEKLSREREYEMCANRLQNAQERLKYYENESDAKASKMATLSTQEYENGEISYVEHVAALQEAMEMRMKHAETINEYNAAVLDLIGLANKW